MADAMSKHKLIAMDCSDIARDTEAPALARSCSSHTTGGMHMIRQGKIGEVEKCCEADKARGIFNFVSNEMTTDTAWSRAFVSPFWCEI